MSAGSLFRCLSCGVIAPHHDAQLDSDNNLVCGACYLLDPPQEDVDIAVDAVAERLAREAREEKTREHWAGMVRAQNRETSGVCDTCGGRTCDGRCGHGCR